MFEATRNRRKCRKYPKSHYAGPRRFLARRSLPNRHDCYGRSGCLPKVQVSCAQEGDCGFRIRTPLRSDHRHAQQWQHVRMTKGLPGHNLPAEPLRQDQFVDTHRRPIAQLATHSSGLLEVMVHVHLHNLGCDLLAMMPTLPHVRKSAVAHQVLIWVVTERNHQ